MRWWFKVNQNKLYRKYNFDPHGFIIRKAKLTRTFKFLLKRFKFNYLKKVRWGQYVKYLRKKGRRKFNLKRIKKIKNIKKIRKHNLNKKILKNKWAIKNKYKNMKLSSWKLNFWNKFKVSYFNFNKKKFITKNFKKLKRSRTIRKWKKVGWLSKQIHLYKRKKNRLMQIRKVGIHKVRKEEKNKKKKLMSSVSWLKIPKLRVKKKAWWLLRVALKKTAYYYGIKSLQKFRYINNLNNKAMALKSYYNYKLECMLNMVLFRLNLFDNIYFSINYIKICGVLVNYNVVAYPFRFVKMNDIVSFPNKDFKKIFSVFVKRARYNKSYLFKKIFQKKLRSFKRLHLVKNFVNLPQYFEYNYKIMHFIIWRLPNRRELNGPVFKHKNSYDWCLNTQLQYN